MRAAGGRAGHPLPGGWQVVHGNPVRLRSALAGDPAVAAVEPDLRRRASGEDPYLQKAQRSTMDAIRWTASLPGVPGGDLVVAVVDSGVAPDHPDLKGRVLAGYDALGLGSTDDHARHGTQVAGIIAAIAGNDLGVAGVASGARILPVRVLGQDGYGYDSDIAQGVRWAADHGADVINLSLAGYGSTTVLRDAVAYAHAAGAVVVAASGNGAGGHVAYPASYPHVVSVGGVDGSLDPMGNSQWNEYLDLMAPGWRVMTTDAHGDLRSYWPAAGTSFSAAFVSAAAARVRAQNPGWGPDQVARRLTSTATDIGPHGWDERSGWGVLDLTRALGGTARPDGSPARADQHEPNDVPSAATVAPTDQITFARASISPEGDVDWWKVQVNEPSRISIFLELNGAETREPRGSGLDVEIYDSDLQLLRPRQGFGAEDAHAPAAGTYLVGSPAPGPMPSWAVTRSWRPCTRKPTGAFATRSATNSTATPRRWASLTWTETGSTTWSRSSRASPTPCPPGW